MVIGYARVSGDKQDEQNQEYEIRRFLLSTNIGVCEKMVSESITSRSDKRQIYELVKTLKAGDIFVFTELSRLGRSMSDLRMIFDSIIARGARIILIKHNLDPTPVKTKTGFELIDPLQKMMINCLAMAAEFERDLLQQRTIQGLQSKKEIAVQKKKDELGRDLTPEEEKEAFKIGRPKGSTGFHEPEKVAKAKKLYADGYKKKHICSSLGISFPTLQDYLATPDSGIKSA